jgi:glutaredoxin
MDELNNVIRNERCVVFCKKRCGFCDLADDFFMTHGLACRKVMLEDFPKLARPLQEKTDQTTLPNIFINGAPVGGYQHLVEKYERCHKMKPSERDADVICVYLVKHQGV